MGRPASTLGQPTRGAPLAEGPWAFVRKREQVITIEGPSLLLTGVYWP